MAPATTVTGAEDSNRLASHAVHPQKMRELAALRSSSGGGNGGGRPFFVAFCVAVMPLFAMARRSAGSDHVARFPSRRLDEDDVAVMVVAEALNVLSLALPIVKPNGGHLRHMEGGAGPRSPLRRFLPSLRWRSRRRCERAARPATPSRWGGDAPRTATTQGVVDADDSDSNSEGSEYDEERSVSPPPPHASSHHHHVVAPVAQQPQPPSFFTAVRRSQTTVTSMLTLLEEMSERG